MRVLGIDPGVSGAAALVTCSDILLPPKVETVFDFEVISEKKSNGKTRNTIDILTFSDFICSVSFDFLTCERMHPSPTTSGVTGFSMGQTMGALIALFTLYKIPYHLVSPSTWKGTLQCPADKNEARLYAQDFFKDTTLFNLKRQHNQAEAALIAAYGIHAFKKD